MSSLATPADVGVLPRSLPQAPPEGWEKLLGRYQRWCARHPRFLSGLTKAVWVAYSVAIPLLIAAIVLLPRFQQAIVPALVITLNLATLLVLARTRTICWRTMSLVYGLSIPWAFGIAILTVQLSAVGGLAPSSDGSMIALAAFLEEPAKLLPLLGLCLIAPGRMRRLASVDWALLGFAAGAGFMAAEDFARRVHPPSIMSYLREEPGVAYSWNPWASGTFLSPDESAIAPGHHVWTSNIAMAIGLSVVIWRARTIRGHRLLALLPPLAVIALTVSDHAAFNAAVDSRWPDQPGDGFPPWMQTVWTLGGQGRLSMVLSVAMFAICMLVDAHRRASAGRFGVTLAAAPGLWRPQLANWHPILATPVRALCAWLSFTWSDLAVVWAAHAAQGRPRLVALREGQKSADLVRRHRGDAMTATTPGEEPRKRNWFRIRNETSSLPPETPRKKNSCD